MTPRPKVTPTLIDADPPMTSAESAASPGIRCRARRSTTRVEITTMNPIHTHAHAPASSDWKRAVNTRPTASNCTAARTEASTTSRVRPRRSQAPSANATVTMASDSETTPTAETPDPTEVATTIGGDATGLVACD